MRSEAAICRFILARWDGSGVDIEAPAGGLTDEVLAELRHHRVEIEAVAKAAAGDWVRVCELCELGELHLLLGDFGAKRKDPVLQSPQQVHAVPAPVETTQPARVPGLSVQAHDRVARLSRQWLAWCRFPECWPWRLMDAVKRTQTGASSAGGIDDVSHSFTRRS